MGDVGIVFLGGLTRNCNRVQRYYFGGEFRMEMAFFRGLSQGKTYLYQRAFLGIVNPFLREKKPLHTREVADVNLYAYFSEELKLTQLSHEKIVCLGGHSIGNFYPVYRPG
jgi:hypothetical protein